MHIWPIDHDVVILPGIKGACLYAGTLMDIQWERFPDVTFFTFDNCNLTGPLPEGNGNHHFYNLYSS